MTARDRTGKFTAERTTTTITERLTVEPGTPGPLLPAQEWARLTAPLEHYQVPVIVTPAARAEWAQLTGDLRAGRETDRDLLDEWHGKALLAALRPLDDWMHQFTPPLPQVIA